MTIIFSRNAHMAVVIKLDTIVLKIRIPISKRILRLTVTDKVHQLICNVEQVDEVLNLYEVPVIWIRSYSL